MSKGAADTQTQSASVTGGNSNFVAASGNLGSSSLSAYAGPWYIETQNLTVNYVRIPAEQYWNNRCDATLSGLSTTHGNIQSTYLLLHFNATYDATVAYQTFNASSVQQAQEFTVIAASGDPNGISYGTVSGNILGPMGSIITSKPYIRRVPYTGVSSQPLVSKVSNGSTFAIYDSSTVSASPAMIDGTSFFTDLNYWAQFDQNPVGNASLRRELKTVFWAAYHIPGVYSTSKEFIPLDTLIDAIANGITNQSYYAWPIANQQSGLPKKDEGLPEYDKNRHA